jgi:hypothetical protein
MKYSLVIAVLLGTLSLSDVQAIQMDSMNELVHKKHHHKKHHHGHKKDHTNV